MALCKGEVTILKLLLLTILSSRLYNVMTAETMIQSFNFYLLITSLSLRLLLLLYLLFMTFLTTSLVLAAKSTDPSQYDNDLDWFRLFCEVVTLLWVLMDLGLEVYDLGCVMLVFFSYTMT